MIHARRRGWCPSALRPMATGDGLLMRLRPPLSRLSLAQAQGFAEAVQRHGNGMIDLTSRGNLQVRGLTPMTHQAMLEAATALDLLDVHSKNGLLPELPCTLISSPFAGPSAILSLRAALEAGLRAEPRLAGLPAKFSIVLDEQAEPLFDDIPAHLRALVRAEGDVLLVGGGQQEAISRAAAPQALVQRALAATRGPKSSRGQAAPGLRATFGPGPAQRRQMMPGAISLGSAPAFAFGLGFGSMQASALLALVAELRYAGATELRLTPWHLLLALPMREGAMPGLMATAQVSGFIVTADDPRRALSACPGQPFCLQAHLPVRDDAQRLAAGIGASLLHRNLHVHLSGCDKFCACPPQADFILEAKADGYHVSGRAWTNPGATRLTLAEAALGLA
ncbi:MAG: hypothetical protein KGQ37_06590 [Hyphomicrobiales bacterium]|nr:hypothetical protein [Hyphomicrobiales bacterium]